MADRRSERRAALREALVAAHVDAVLLTSLPNIRYITGFSGSSALALITARDTLLITDFRYATQVRDEVGDFARVAIESQSLWTGLWQLLPEIAGVKVIAFESGQLLHRDFERLLNAGGRWQWRPTNEMVETLREQKDPDEVASILEAAEVARRALERTIPQIGEGMSELEIAGVLEHSLRGEGSEGFPFETIVASGPRSALPHAHAADRQVGAGDFLLIDYGAIVDGYCSDVTRTFVVGRASDEQRELYEIVRGANAYASANVRAGMTGRDADALARQYIEQRGQGNGFGHSLGHGIGLEVHEAPRLSKTAEAALPVQAVVTIEPGIYRAGWGGVRIEDDVVLDSAGPRILTSFPRDLMEIA